MAQGMGRGGWVDRGEFVVNFYKKMSLVYVAIAMVFLFVIPDKAVYPIILAAITALHSDVDKLKERLK